MDLEAKYARDISVLWEYLTQSMHPVRSDVIMVFGSHDEHTAEKAAELWHDGLSDVLLFSGGLGKITEKIWCETEAERFSRIAEDAGVPSHAILKETESHSTYENIVFSKELLKAEGLVCGSILAVDKPYKVRRTFLMLSDMWDDVSICTAREDVLWQDYLKRYEGAPLGVSCEDVISLMTGEVHRIMALRGREYIPYDVYASYERLCSQGFDRYCV